MMKKKWRQVLVADTVWNVFLEVAHQDGEQPLYRVTIRQHRTTPQTIIVFHGWSVDSVRQTAHIPSEAERMRFFYAVNSSLSTIAPLVEAVQLAQTLSVAQ